MTTATEAFRGVMSNTGLDYHGEIYADGKLHRFKASGDHSKNSWYVLYPGFPVAGAYGCWKRGIKETWCERRGSLTQSEWQNVRERWKAAKRERERVETDRQEKAREIAAWILKRSQPALTLHRYLSGKRVKVFGELRMYGRSLVLPLRDINGELHSLQFIDGDGKKRFLTGGRIKGCFFTLSDKADGPLVPCEGYATGASIHEATGHAVICALNCGSLPEVAKTLREKFPQREIIIAADNDSFRKNNPGLREALSAAKAIRAKLAVPQFKFIALAGEPTDFNDIALLAGLGEVKRQIQAASEPGQEREDETAGENSSGESDDATIRRLAAMSRLEYECIRKAEAKKLGYRVSVLDSLVEARKSEKPRNTEAPVESIPLRIAKLKEPGQSVSFERWRGVIRENFPILLRPAEVCLSVVAQLLLNDVSNPFAIALVDVPSSSKTITLNFFDGPTELTYTTDNFTPASFVSHASNLKREDLGDVDLLPRIRYHTLIVRDLGSIFGANDDDLIKSLGILTRVLDGEGLETDSGVHGRRGYKGDYLFMLLAGTPPIQPRVFKIMGNLGSRLFFLRLHTPDEDDDELIAQNKGTAWKLKESACRGATENFLRTVWAANQKGVTWNKAEDPEDCLRVIARCARLLARLRGAINVWPADEAGEKLLHTEPVIEKPRRINCLFYNLARAHALICGRGQLTVEDLWPVLDVTCDTAPNNRAKVIRGLIEADGILCTSDVVKLLRCSPPTARKEMEALSVLGVVDKTGEGKDEPGRPETQITLVSRFAWFKSDECKSLMSMIPVTQGENLFLIFSLGKE